MTGFQLTTSPTAGYVLTSDASGNGTWLAPTGGGIGGSGTQYYLARFTNATTLGSSIIFESTGGNVGIGTAAPSTRLHVVGTLRTDALLLPSSPHTGYVLTSDAGGMGTWQAPAGGLTLPYSGSVSSTGAAFSVTNTGTSAGTCAIAGIINNASTSSDAAAGLFNATGSNGYGILASSDMSGAIRADYNGTSSYAFYGSSSGVGGAYFSCSKLGGSGVRGRATNSGSSSTARGGWFECSAPLGQGVYAISSGSEATGIYTEASGTNGTGLIAKGANAGALIYGNVTIYEYGTSNKVIELGKGLDYAEGFDVAGAAGEVTPGTVLVIDPAHPGKLACSRTAYDRRVAGIVAGANGLGSGVRLGTGQFDRDVALAGRVYCNVIALESDVQPGDLLTTSNVPGHAMKVADATRAPGAVLGKAMEPLAKGERGRILVLVTLQ
jgi:hypothetical protein